MIDFLGIFKKIDPDMLMSPSVPIDMRISEPDEDGWCKWQPVKSTITMHDINTIESAMQTLFPDGYKNLILNYHFLDLDFGDFMLMGSPSDNREYLKRFMLESDISSLLIENNLIPIGVGLDGHSYLVLNEDGNVLQAYTNDNQSLETKSLNDNFVDWFNEQCSKA